MTKLTKEHKKCLAEVINERLMILDNQKKDMEMDKQSFDLSVSTLNLIFRWTESRVDERDMLESLRELLC